MEPRTEYNHFEVYEHGARIVLKTISPFREMVTELTPDEARELATMLGKVAKTVEASNDGQAYR